MIKIYTLKECITFSSEQIILFGLLENYNTINIEPHNRNFKGESRYNGLIETCKRLFSYVDNIKECDIIVFPYKFKEQMTIILKYYLIYHNILKNHYTYFLMMIMINRYYLITNI